MLITGGLTDPRVTYWEPAKWAAKLRATKTDDNLLLLKINMGAGHGGKSGRWERLHEVAETYGFILTQVDRRKTLTAAPSPAGGRGAAAISYLTQRREGAKRGRGSSASSASSRRPREPSFPSGLLRRCGPRKDNRVSDKSVFELTLTAGPEHIDELGHVNNAVWVQWIQQVAVAHWDSVADRGAQGRLLLGRGAARDRLSARGARGDRITARTWVGDAPQGRAVRSADGVHRRRRESLRSREDAMGDYRQGAGAADPRARRKS